MEHDARLKKLVLTEKARALVDRSEQDMRDMEALLAKGLSEGGDTGSEEIFRPDAF